MFYDLSPGDVVQIGDAVTLTILAVEGDLIRFKLEPQEEECPGPGLNYDDDSRQWQQKWWELN